ncbi:MAG: YceI family protein [Bacteroidales bacterium]|nr:YceI family protein [Bacteroidales bacterium]
MRRITTILFAITLTFSVYSAETYKVDTKASEVYWKGTKPGGSHYGIVSVSSGSIEVDGDKILAGEFTIDFNAIRVDDLEGEWRDKLVGHLKSEDFFYTEKYPYGRFVITKAEKKSGNVYSISGELTARGVTKEVSFEAKVDIADGKLKGKTDIFKLDRTDWDLKYNSAKFSADLLKDKIIDDMMEIKITLVTK